MSDRLLIEQVLPVYDAIRREHAVVQGPIEGVYEATLTADFLDAWRSSFLVRLLFGVRSMGERTVAAVRGLPLEEPQAPDKLRLTDMTEQGEWVRLGDNPPDEFVFGAIGRFWSGKTSWESINAADFHQFDRPGFAKIACNFSLRSYGAEHTIVTYECRTQGTDPVATKGFLRYWRPLSPAIGVILRAQLAVIARQASR